MPGKDVNGRRFTFLLRPNRGRSGVEPLVTPTVTDYDSASSIGDGMDTMSLGEADVEERYELGSVSEEATEEIEENAILRVPTWQITEMKKERNAYDAAPGRGQSLLRYVFS